MFLMGKNKNESNNLLLKIKGKKQKKPPKQNKTI